MALLTFAEADKLIAADRPTPPQTRILQLCEGAGNMLVEWQDGIFIEPMGVAASRKDVRALVYHGLVYEPGSLPIARGGPGPLEEEIA